MALYRVNDDKAFKILLATSPNVIFINGPRFSEYMKFAEKFKETDLNILQLTSVFQRMSNKFVATAKEIEYYFATGDTSKPDLEYALVQDLNAYINRCDRVVIVGCVSNVNLISKIFDNTFTYVYVYPNVDAKYKETIIQQLETQPLPGDPTIQKNNNKATDAFVSKMLKQRKKEFKEHVEFLGRALVVLDK